ncbi:hypothetical protein [Pontitalea aquivivens]|uniref:hypothetical protein n=1 Tax=Pontitalea aquivivens TaxID=3388663 RepID=UPI003970515A
MSDWIDYERARMARQADARACDLHAPARPMPHRSAHLPPIVPQAELDRRAALESYRRSHWTAAVATACGVTWTVLLIWIDPIKWFL